MNRTLIGNIRLRVVLNWRRGVKAILVLALVVSLGACAGKQLTSISNSYYFIPPHERFLYINESVNLTQNFPIGITIRTALRRYYENHSTLSGVRYKEASLILTVYILKYKLVKFDRLDLYGQNKLEITLDLELDVLKKKNKSETTSAYLNRDKHYAYLRRVPMRITAHSDERSYVPSAIEQVEALLVVKLIRTLNHFFKTGNPPPTLISK